MEVGKLVQAKEWRSESRKSGDRKAERVEIGKLVQAKEWRSESLNKKKSRDGKACTDKRVEVGMLVPVGIRVEVGKLVQAKEWS